MSLLHDLTGIPLLKRPSLLLEELMISTHTFTPPLLSLSKGTTANAKTKLNVPLHLFCLVLTIFEGRVTIDMKDSCHSIDQLMLFWGGVGGNLKIFHLWPKGRRYHLPRIDNMLHAKRLIFDTYYSLLCAMLILLVRGWNYISLVFSTTTLVMTT